MRSILRRTAAVVSAAVALLTTTSASQALAVPPPPGFVNPMQCIVEFNDNPDYVGEGWVNAPVLDVNGVFLGCGDERSGFIHIAHPESTGNVHPVYPAQVRDFSRCFQNIANFGMQRPDNNFPDTRTRYEYVYYVDSILGPIPQTGTIVKDNAGRFVWTMFTPETSDVPQGNDWIGCAGPEAAPQP